MRYYVIQILIINRRTECRYWQLDRNRKYHQILRNLSLYNPNFKPLEFEGFRKEAGSNTFI